MGNAATRGSSTVSEQAGFTRHGDNAFIAQFSESEREVLINLAGQIIELLSEGLFRVYTCYA